MHRSLLPPLPCLLAIVPLHLPGGCTHAHPAAAAAPLLDSAHIQALPCSLLPLPPLLLPPPPPSPPAPADFKATCAAYIKAVFSMPGAITNQEVGARAAQEQWVADQRFITAEERVWEALPGANTPVLIMNGDLDVLVPHANARRIAARIPGARLHTFEGWGHGFKNPAALAEVVNEFLLGD